MQQVIINLLKNALKFTSRGSIQIKTSYNYIEQTLCIHLRDSGTGISRENLQSLLQRNPEQADDGGRGMLICKKIVAQNEGEIEVYSEGLECGTTLLVSMKMQDVPKDEIGRGNLIAEFKRSWFFNNQPN